MKTKTTQVSTRRNEMNHTRASVMEVTGMTLLEYNTFIFDCGIALLENGEFKIKSDELIRMKEYWSWFRNEFFIFEKETFDQMAQYGPEFNHENISVNRYLYEREMSYIIADGAVRTSLYHFLKTF
jgi:hypothetical protein